jgi:hypothetical protein
MPLGEGNTRTGFQIPLQGNSATLLGKLNDHID